MKKIKKFIRRKTMIYKTGVEYGDYTINHVLGCSHGCKYPCYAYMMKKRFGDIASYEEWCEPALVENTLEILDDEIPKFKSKIHMLHLCFTTDPFMYEYDEVGDMSLAAIKKLNAAGIPCSVLTKGILPAELANCSKENEYGITMTYEEKEEVEKMCNLSEYVWEKGLREGREEGLRTGINYGELQNLVRMVLKKMRKDVSCEITAELFEEPVEKIRKIYEVAEKYAPEYDIESICRELAA